MRSKQNRRRMALTLSVQVPVLVLRSGASAAASSVPCVLICCLHGHHRARSTGTQHRTWHQAPGTWHSALLIYPHSPMPLLLRAPETCRWDCVSLGEVMLRLDPGDGRVHTARTFQVWEGGGEYNVARGLKRCFGLNTAVVTALADNPVGRLVEDLMFQGGVEQRVTWVKYDGVGRTVRNGLNFTERGFGVRAALGCSDRGHTAISQLTPGVVDWDEIFGTLGARWLHTGGIFCALSETTPLVAEEAMAAARRHGTLISYDLNYRDSLWKSIGGQAKARDVNRRLAPYIDVMLGNEEDFSAALGFEIEGVDEHLSELDPATFTQHDRDRRGDVPQLQGRRHDVAERDDGDAQ